MFIHTAAVLILAAAYSSNANSCIATSISPTSVKPAPSQEPCAEVSSSWAAAIATQPTPTVAASLAYACLNSAPLNKTEAVGLIDALRPYLDWQSTNAYLADPPADYYFPAVDVFANLDMVRSNAEEGVYQSEYEFQADLVDKVILRAHEGHTNFGADLLYSAFEFNRAFSLISISQDGRSLPVIKLYEDVAANSETASEVKLINGGEASRYIIDLAAAYETSQDIDSGYNTLFYSRASFALAKTISPAYLDGVFRSGGTGSQIYKGPSTTITFANGTVVERDNYATVIGNFTGIVDGPSLYDKFCNTGNSGEKLSKAASDKRNYARDSSDGSVPGYPAPILRTSVPILSCYFLSEQGYEDVAVISILAFDFAPPPEFQHVLQECFRKAVAAGKKRLIVDLQANAGGNAIQGLDFTRQLLPDIEPDGLNRFRTNEAFVEVARLISKEVAGFNPYTSSDVDLIYDATSVFNYRNDLNLTGQNFASFEDEFTQEVYKDTVYSAIGRFNLSDPLATVNDTFGGGVGVTGYGSLPSPPQPFDRENIVVIYDGACVSTCALVSEVLLSQGGLKSVVFGGRPLEGPMQPVGETRGSGVFPFAYIHENIQKAASLTNDTDVLAEFMRYSDLPIRRSLFATVNVRNRIPRARLVDNMPDQFVTRYADCRMFYTEAMVRDVGEVWKAAVDVAFGDATCAHGDLK